MGFALGLRKACFSREEDVRGGHGFCVQFSRMEWMELGVGRFETSLEWNSTASHLGILERMS